MSPTIRVRCGRVLLLFFLSAVALLGQSSVAVAQTTLATCLSAAVPAQHAIERLQELTIAATDAVDVADIETAIADAIDGLADNVLGEAGDLSKLAEVCERLVSDDLGPIIAEDDCAPEADGVTCDGAELFSNFQDVVEGLGEDAVPQITNPALVDDLRGIIANIYESMQILVQWAITEAQASGTSGGSGSDSPSIDDALSQQSTADGQAKNCVTGTGEQRACGDAAASYFDAWFNAIIEIIEQ
jgi:hypothetical protein